MKPQNFASLIETGAVLRYLLHAGSAASIYGQSFVKSNITYFLNKLEENQFIVTKAACWELTTLLEEFNNDEATDELLGDLRANRLSLIMGRVEHTLRAEAQTKLSYVLTDKRIELQKLVSGVEQLFPTGVFQKLTDLCKFDFQEAGKCLAFERPTAAAFHLMRSTEETLRRYYCNKVKRDRLNPLLWGPMVAALRKKQRPNVGLLNHLDHIRIFYRNPTQHPDMVYTMDDAQNLFHLAVDVVSLMSN